jgi:hypothetical protein
MTAIFCMIFNFASFIFDMMKGFDQKESFNLDQATAYTSIAPLIFNVGLILIILPSLLYIRKGGESNNNLKADLSTLMTYECWRILYKLSTAAYICHYLIVFWYFASIHSNGLILGRWVILRATFGSLVFSFVIGLVFYLIIDKPIRNLDRLVLFPSKISDSFLIKK